MLGDIRVSHGRREGKLDAQSERNKKNEQTLEHHDVRLTSLETKHDRLQTVVKMVAWAGSAIMAIFTLLGDRILSFLFRSEEHTSELQSLMRISYAVFCLKKKKKKNQILHSLYLQQ